MTLSLRELPPLSELETHLRKPVRSISMVRPRVNIGDWEIHYDPSSRSPSGLQSLPWVGRVPCRMYQCATLEQLLLALKEDEK